MPAGPYTSPITDSQAHELQLLLAEEGFVFVEKEYALFSAAKAKLNVTVFDGKKGLKLVVQGKETEDFIRFTLEPRIFGEAKLGYEEVHNPEMFQPHFGIDESGKGDFFGPLVIAGAYVDAGIARHLLDAGVQDSKAIKSDSRIRALANLIRETPGLAYEVIPVSPARYNEMYESFANLNKLLAWGHAKVIENLHARIPTCPRALSDQFANPRELQRALSTRGCPILLEQRTKAESDIAVAAASILAREKFINWLRDKGEELGLKLPRGASTEVQALTLKLRSERGPDFLREVGKTHFKFANDLL